MSSTHKDDVGPGRHSSNVGPGFSRADVVVNAMSIDVEDYFHVSVFDGIVPRSAWANSFTDWMLE